jgi:hypothetical protein
MLYSRDLARILMWALDDFDDDAPLIVAGDEVTVRNLAEIACDAVGCTLCSDYKLTPREEAIQDTAKWYLMHTSERVADAAHVPDQM